MCENNKVELIFKNLNLKCEGYSMNDVISLVKALDSNYDDIQKTNEITRNIDVEEVNLRELGKTVRMPKTTNNFRCPNCGQALMAFYIPSSGESMLLVREIISNNVATYKANVLSLPKVESLDYFISIYKDLLGLLGDKVVLVENSEDICSCPYCLEERTISEWINAYNNPLDVFEISDICDFCGHEGNVVISQTGEYVSCENNCMKKFNELTLSE